MRSLGISEEFITGNATDEEKFHAWAKVVPQTIRNPLFHWTHLELKNVFGVHEYLNADNADKIYQQGNALLKSPDMTTRSLLAKFKVEYVGTTDEPWDDLEFHRQIKSEQTSLQVAPSFRPDKLLMIANKETFLQSIQKLQSCTSIEIKDINSLLDALQQRVNYFHELGGRISDHGLNHMPLQLDFSVQLENEFKSFLKGDIAVFSDPDALMGYVLLQLCKMYHAKGWVQQFHLGPIRNNNSRLNKNWGPIVVSIPSEISTGTQSFQILDRLDGTDQLTKQ